jgi:hypothetical protein
MAANTNFDEAKQAGEGGAERLEKPEPETIAQAASRQARVMSAGAYDPDFDWQTDDPGEPHYSAAWANQRAAELNAGTGVGEEHARIAAEHLARMRTARENHTGRVGDELDAMRTTANAMYDHACATQDPHDFAAAADAAWRVEHWYGDDLGSEVPHMYHSMYRDCRLAAGSARLPRFGSPRAA